MLFLIALLCALTRGDDGVAAGDTHSLSHPQHYVVSQASENPLFNGYVPHLNKLNDDRIHEGKEQEPSHGHAISQVEGVRKRANMTSRTDGGFHGTIHSVVVEAKFGVPLTQNINQSFEYLFEFTYNASMLQVSEPCPPSCVDGVVIR